MKKIAEEEEKKAQNKLIMEQKFRPFHENQKDKIKKIEMKAQDKKKLEEERKIRSKEKDVLLHQSLKTMMDESDRNIM